MRHTRNVLLSAFIAAIAIAVALVAVFESGLADVGIKACDGRTEFFVTTFMELLTLACIPTALRLFKMHSVAERLNHDGFAALLPLGLLRIAMLGLPLVANTLLYYMYMATPFGYMAILLLISMVFVYPSMGRCESETDTKEEDVKE